MKKIALLLLLISHPAFAAASANPFAYADSTKTISATGSSSSTTFSDPNGVNAQQFIIKSPTGSAATAFCRWGVGAQKALTTDYPILPGEIEVLTKGQADTIACITASSTATIYVTAGNGN